MLHLSYLFIQISTLFIQLNNRKNDVTVKVRYQKKHVDSCKSISLYKLNNIS